MENYFEHDLSTILTTQADKPRSITTIETDKFDDWFAKQNDALKAWCEQQNFKGNAGELCLYPDELGNVQYFLAVNNQKMMKSYGNASMQLPEGDYVFSDQIERRHCIAKYWAMGAYQYTYYKAAKRKPARLYVEGLDQAVVEHVKAIFWVRDLINTPTEDMYPEVLAKQAKLLAEKYSATLNEIVDEDLLKQNYPLVHAVGRASERRPRLVDIVWGDAKNPKITLVGKGVCYDTGGLNIKTGNGMLTMKKDMGGAAHVLGLARMIMSANLPVRLRVLVPMVENSIGGNAYRPGDILPSRKGLTVEIKNTDAEGRLILADALTEACTESPELLIDFATLTGASRVAVGTDLAALYTTEKTIARDLVDRSEKLADWIWHMPLVELYDKMLDADLADLQNVTMQPYGGGITAGLFLQRFVEDNQPWLHFDVMAATEKARPGSPKGGEAQGLRTVFEYLAERYQ